MTLKPHTTYTLVAWIKTEAVSGSPGAQVYAWGFEGAAGTELITVKGTTPWQRYTVAFTTADDVSGRINGEIVVGHGRLDIRRQQVVLGQDGLVGVGAHHHARIEDARQGGQGALQLHQDHGVVVSSRSDFCSYSCHSYLQSIRLVGLGA